MTLTKLLNNNFNQNFPFFFEDSYFNPLDTRSSTKSSLAANVIEKKDHFQIDLEAPGVSKEDIEITFKNHTLKVKGKKENKVDISEASHYSIESRYGEFERSWIVKDVDYSKVKAEFENGILSITLPKKQEVIEKEVEKKIAIK